MIIKKQNREKRTVYRRASRPTRQTQVNVGQAQKIIGQKKDEHVKIVPLGGLEEVGRNMMYLEYHNPGSPHHGDIIIIDMGLQFPEENMPGIDYIIPNVSSLIPKREKIKGIIITHAHYDHIGGIPHLMPKLGRNIPILGTDLTLAIIKKRQADYKPATPLNLKEINTEKKVKAGAFQLEFFGISHNIPASMGIIINTPVGVLVHTGDFKLDVKSDIAGKTEIEKIKALGNKNVLLLMSDSTNASSAGHQFSEKEITLEIESIIKNATGRLIIGTFASLLGRLNEIIQIAEKHDKKIIIEGYSMKTNIEIATQLGYMKFNKKTVIHIGDMANYPPHKIIILATGAQGEDNAVLMRIVNKRHRYLRIQPTDTVVFSSSVVPGNERSVQHLTDKLYRDGAEVINYRMLDIHAGGHAKQEDLKEMIQMIKPRYLMPIEGNHSFLKIHAKIGRQAGLKEDQIIVSDNGQITEAYKDKVQLTKEYVPANYVMVDGLGVGDMQEVVLRDRQALAQDGIFVIIAVVDSQNGKVRGSPDIISRGFIYLRESKKLLYNTRQLTLKIIEETTSNIHPINWEYVKEVLKERLGKFLFSQTEKRPMVLPVIIEV